MFSTTRLWCSGNTSASQIIIYTFFLRLLPGWLGGIFFLGDIFFLFFSKNVSSLCLYIYPPKEKHEQRRRRALFVVVVVWRARQSRRPRSRSRSRSRRRTRRRRKQRKKSTEIVIAITDGGEWREETEID